MRLKIVLLIAVTIFGHQIWQRGTASASLDYRSGWTSAVAEARETGQLILLNFGGPW